MSLLRQIRYSLRALVGRRGVERDMDREMALHVDMEAARLVSEGVSADDAHRRAAVAFGGRQRFREEARDVLRNRLLEDFIQDIAHALRVFRRTPALTATVLLTLAVGIGATTVIFSITDHVVLRPLPYADADRLVNLQIVSDNMSKVTDLIPVNAAHFVAWSAACTACAEVAAISTGSLTLSGAGDPTQIAVVRASGTLFTMLGGTAERGRLFVSGNDAVDAEREVVLSDALWRQQFGGRDDVVGHFITLNDVPWRVLGVVSPEFQMPRGHELNDLANLPGRTDAFIPLVLSAQEKASHGQYDFNVIARLRRGASIAVVRAQLDAANAEVAARIGDDGPPARTAVTQLQQQIVGQAGRPLVLLLAAVGSMLLLMCVNLANLLLARSAARRREASVRHALGAARERLVRQALTETALLTAGGGAVGIVLAGWGLRALLALAPASLPRIDEVHIDGGVLGVAILLSIVAGLSFGLAPAWRFGGTAPGEVLKESSRSSTDTKTGKRARSMLIAIQVGMSALLLVTSGLLLKSFVRVLGVDKGFTADHVLALDVVLPRGAYPTRDLRNQLYSTALDTLRSLPGVIGSAVTSALPVEGESWVDELSVGSAGPGMNANFRFVSPELFSVLGQPLISGRTFRVSDRGRRVLVLSANAAQALWPGANPIGRQVHAGSDSTYQVIGIVPDVRTSGLEHAGSVIAYKPYWEMGLPAATLLVRTRGDPAAMAASARVALRGIGAAIPISRVRTMDEVISGAVAERRFEAVLIGLFALTALLTASIGIYGMISHSLARRTNELGIRIALGARPVDVHTLVLSEMMRPVVIGVLGGVAASLLAGRLIAGLLFEVQPMDVEVLLSVAVLVSLIAVAACMLPLRRASRTDPIEALRAG